MSLRYLAVVLIALATGCDPDPPASGGASRDVPRAEPALAEQVAAVREGRSTVIRVTRRVTDADLDALADLENLQRLILEDAALTAVGTRKIGALNNLQTLRIVDAAGGLDDASVAPLAESSSLRHLILVGAPLTDAGLAPLAAMKNLESLYLFDTAVTDAGLNDLHTRRPDLHVHW